MADEKDTTPLSAETKSGPRSLLWISVAVVALLAGLGLIGHAIVTRLDAVDRRVAELSEKTDEAATFAQQAMQRAGDAEALADAAAAGRRLAEAEAAEAHDDADRAREEADQAREEADLARDEAATAREAAARAEARAKRIQQEAQLELDRLENAFRQIAETRRTALGLVMSLGSDYLKFEFDKAELRPQDRELLSRIAGILLSSKDFTISVNGHTDDVGTAEYNQKLSERRAQAVRDYLVEAGLPPEIFTVVGHGKARPLVPGRSPEARAKNRRVELGIVNTRIVYGRSTRPRDDG